MLISPIEAEGITKYMDVTANTEEADLLFLFGTMLPEPAYLAVDAFRQNQIKFIVLTGGVNRHTGENEADAHLQILLSNGIPQERIVVENESRNTRENVLFALPAMMKRFDLDSIKSIMVVTKWHHCRRAMMTLKRHLPLGTHYYTLWYEQAGITRSGWWQHQTGYSRVMHNWQAIQAYLQRDHIAEVRWENGAYI